MYENEIIIITERRYFLIKEHKKESMLLLAYGNIDHMQFLFFVCKKNKINKNVDENNWK